MARETAARKHFDVADFVQETAAGASSTWLLYLAARRPFASDAALAEALGVHRSQVARWKRGGQADPANEERLRDLGTVVDSLTGYLEPDAISDWLSGVNAHLGHRRPIDVLLAGHLTDVIAAVEAERRGAYA
ncbi:hypothetical protein BH20GEM1_BH20GEM1_15950 [soil metagenome]